MGGVCVWHCAAISGFWAASRARFAQYRSTHLPVRRGLPSNPGCLTSTVLRYCLFWAWIRPLGCDIAAHTSAVGLGMSGSWALPSDLGRLTSTVLRYLVFRPPPGPVSANIAAQYSWSRISGSSGARLPACSTRLGERRKATGATCASPVTANCVRNSHHIMIGCNEN